MHLPHGYRYSAVYAGIRKTEKPDLALIHTDLPAAAAGVFTTNRVKAAPVLLCQENLEATRGHARSILVNAGNANCATRTGQKTALQSIMAASKELGVGLPEVLPASTGVIGVELDARLISRAMPELVAGLSAARFLDAADAIMTTDTFRKVASVEVGGVSIAGMTKGAGMIHPNMATTLAFVVTDAIINPAGVRGLLERAVERSYHRISVDGDTSTNDTVILLANGASKRAAPKEFEGALGSLMQDLARQIARDGEGAKKLISIEVRGAATKEDATRMARSIANSPLVKTAIAGSDPNWGRILCAAGYSGVEFDPQSVDIRLQGVQVCRQGVAAEFSEPELKAMLDAPDVVILFSIAGKGAGTAQFWTCDLTHGYIDVNASYRT